MINLRYHIVSITAVFLALGIGLTLGTAFLDRVTVDNLKSQLDEVSAEAEATDRANSLLTDRLEELDRSDQDLAEAIGRLVPGHLEEVPVLVVAARGTDEDEVRATMAALRDSGAEVAGTWWLTERWDLDDEEELDALREVLDRSSGDAEDLRESTAASLASLLQDAAEVPTTTDDAPPAGPDDDEEPTEPELVANLARTGFIEYERLDGGDEPVLLPVAGARYLVVSDGPADEGPTEMASALVRSSADLDGVPVVAAQGDTELEEEDGEPAPERERRTTFVGPLRDDDVVREVVSTVDILDRAAGLFAAVLALEDLGEGVVGHYGIGEDADALLPGPAPG